MTYRRGTASNSYPLPVAAACASCHVDRHVFADGAGRWTGCADCHAEASWKPTSFGITEHAIVARFPLEGAHAAIPCVACHVDSAAGSARFVLALGVTGCAACHETDGRHRTAYEPLACETCHTLAAFSEVAFEHAPEVTSDCARCHGVDDPHGEQFTGRSCASCHGVETFRVDDFDHASTRFALDGAHASVACRSCHTPSSEGTVRYRSLGTECADCHRTTP
jgi:hypothetical protein